MHLEGGIDKLGNGNGSLKKAYKELLFKFDVAEASLDWDTESFGKLYVYYEDILISSVLALIVSDGDIHEKELNFLNNAFDLTYTLEDLKEAYQRRLHIIENILDEDPEDDVKHLAELDKDLAGDYKKILAEAIHRIIESDGIIRSEERVKAEKILDDLCADDS